MKKILIFLFLYTSIFAQIKISHKGSRPILVTNNKTSVTLANGDTETDSSLFYATGNFFYFDSANGSDGITVDSISSADSIITPSTNYYVYFTYTTSLSGSYDGSISMYSTASNKTATISIPFVVQDELDVAFTLQPINYVATEGDTALFIVAISGPAEAHKDYQWYVDDGGGYDAVTEGSHYIGTTNDTLKVVTVIGDNNHTFVCEGKNTACYPSAGCWLNSDAATLTVNPSGGGSYVADYTVGGASSYDYHSITELNAAQDAGTIVSGDIVGFQADTSFYDAPLDCKGGVTYTNYGVGQATIGDSLTTNSALYTVLIDEENVILDSLIISGWKLNSYKGSTQYAVYVTAGNTLIQDCTIKGGQGFGTNDFCDGIGVNRTSGYSQVTITNNEIKNFYHGLRLWQPKNVLVSYNAMHDFWRFQGSNSVGGVAIYTEKGQDDAFDCDYLFIVKNNDIYNFEHSAMWVGVISKGIYEYNNIYNNLDERIYQGGCEHGVVGKFVDVDGMPYVADADFGSMGHVFRYNYVHDLQKYGSPDSSYPRPTDINDLINGTYSKTATGGTGYDYPYYPSASSDQATANTLGGRGYGNYFIHNNIFENVQQKIISKGSTRYNSSTLLGSSSGNDAKYRSDLPSYFVNNTLYDVGNTYITDNDGVIVQDYSSQSPFITVNNIINFTNARTSAISATRYQEVQDNIGGSDYNIYIDPLDSSVTHSLAEAFTNHHYASWYQYMYSSSKTNNINAGANELYAKTLANTFNNTASTTTLSNVGVSGVTITDLRLKSSGEGDGTGMTYTDINSGADFTGRSLQWGIDGTFKGANDIGAIGTP